MTEKTIGELIRARRTDLRQTQVAAAEALGVKQSTISGWEHGQLPRPEIFPALAIWLGVEEEDLAVLCYRGMKAGGFDAQDERINVLEQELSELRRVVTELQGATREPRRQGR